MRASRRSFLRFLSFIAITKSMWTNANEMPKDEFIDFSYSNNGKTDKRVDERFIGISLDKRLIHDLSTISQKNISLIGILKSILGESNFIRIGGNTVSSSFFLDDIASAEKMPHGFYSVDTDILRNLCEFCEELNSCVIYGFGFPADDVSGLIGELEAVKAIFGKRLYSIQLGNEPDQYKFNGLRSKRYSANDYATEWRCAAQKIANLLRLDRIESLFSGPDAASNKLDIIERYLQLNASYIKAITAHRYSMGPPSDPQITPDSLLQSVVDDEKIVRRLVELGTKYKKEVLLTECNSCWGGGKPGVSDGYAASLWGMEFLCRMAALGVKAVMFHSSGSAIYSPFKRDADKSFSITPLGYGMSLFSRFLGSHSLSIRQSYSNRVFAFDAMTRNGRRTALINKGSSPITAKIKYNVNVDMGWDAAVMRLDGSDAVAYQDVSQPRRNADIFIQFKKSAYAGDTILVAMPAFSAVVMSVQGDSRA